MQNEQASQGWSEETSASFIAYGRFFNPERERQFEVIGDLMAAAFGGERNPLIVELCCGAGDLAAHLLARFPAVRYLALDGSPAMLAQTARQCAPFRERVKTELFDIASDGWRSMAERPRAVVSSLAVHHLDAMESARCSAISMPCWRPAGRSCWRTSCDRLRQRALRSRRKRMSAPLPRDRCRNAAISACWTS